MRLSTRTRYGTRALLDIAMHGGNGPVPLSDIAERLDISKKYIGHIVNQLMIVGMLESTRGPQGGYTLARSPKEIRLGEIVHTLDGSMALVGCAERPDFCERSNECAMQEVWVKLKECVDAVLDGVTLADLAKRQEKLNGSSV